MHDSELSQNSIRFSFYLVCYFLKAVVYQLNIYILDCRQEFVKTTYGKAL